jgi:hypothetical protein
VQACRDSLRRTTLADLVRTDELLAAGGQVAPAPADPRTRRPPR